MDTPGGAAWGERLRSGDPRTAEEIFERFAVRLARLAQQNLSRRLAGRLDGEDVVQSAFRTFFRRGAADGFRIDSSSELWRLLAKITVLKARAKGRHHTSGKRDAAAEAGGGDDFPAVAARDPGPEDAVVLVDQIAALLDGLPEDYGLILERRLQNVPVTDIAAELGVSRQTVHRALNLLQDRLTEIDPDARPAGG
jgi:RNA polymerase sigma-70 factor (ECF subfamily)